MEQLKVRNFLVINEATFDVGKVNIIIGPQANGKSVLIKLLYFFREVMSKLLISSIKKNESKKYFSKNVENLFTIYFPKYTWRNKEFNVDYLINDIKINISKTSTQNKVNIKTCDIFNKMFKNLKSKYQDHLKEPKTIIYDMSTFSPTNDPIILNKPYISIDIDKEVSQYFNESVFIPAGRSFFANLQKNIFSFLDQGIDIDPFMKRFGSEYENAKRIYNEQAFQNLLIKQDKTYTKVEKIIAGILNGKYEYVDDQDWIELNGDLINLSNASSGQQESLPMLLMLAVYPFLQNKNNKQRTYFIEEPEAHLFPLAQKKIVSLIGMIYNKNQHSVITTHSPYILTALNILILANDIKNQHNKNEVNKIVDQDFCINFDDVRAYTINNGKLKDIKNQKERLVGINIIDEVSEIFNDEFDKLLSLRV